MTRFKGFARFAATLATVSLFAVPSFAQRGSADFSRFVAIGDSYGAGYESSSLNERHQQYSWPAIIAKQVGLTLCPVNATATDNCFAQPLVSYPGIGPEMILTSITPTIGVAGGQGQPLMTTFGRPYNNLSIPGATVGDVTKVTGAEAQPTRGVEQLARFILRGLGTEVDQAIAQHPTFVAIWIGGNDFLGGVTSGKPSLLTSTDAFRTGYNAMLDRLVAGAPNAGMVVGTLPTNPAAVPFLTTVPPFIVNPATRLPVPGPDGKPIYYVADLGGGNIGQLPAGSYVLLSALAKVQTGYGIPPALKSVPPFNQLPNAGTPLSDSDVITPDEMSQFLTRVGEYNTVITQAAAARNIPVADIKGLFDRFASNQLFIGPFQFSSAYITGGLFSLDGVHLSDIGYMLFANEYIRTINNAYDTHIPVASLSQFFANNGAMFPNSSSSLFGVPVYDTTHLEISSDAAAGTISIFRPTEQPTPTRHRLRIAGH